MSLRKVVILHNEVDLNASIADQDVIVQRDAVRQALCERDHQVDILECTLNLQHTADQLRLLKPDVVFNLVESLGGTDRLMSAATLLLEAMKIPFTGASTTAILRTSDKVSAKRLMNVAGLPTPRWSTGADCEAATSLMAGRAIVKPVWEHASFGMDDDSVIDVTAAADLATLLRNRSASSGCLHFAEEYIDGREFNLSVLEGENGRPVVLPPAEIDFSAFPDSKPRIVGHKAKWCEDSFEYQQTPRSFDFLDSDSQLLQKLTELASACWQTFQLRGYARVDFRVDGRGVPWILETNVNPCLSPDAGFAAALDRGSIDFIAAINQIVDSALNSSSEDQF